MKKSFSLFLHVYNLTRQTYHKTMKPRMQTENLANNSYKQFYVFLNTSQISLYICPDLLKENPLLRTFLNSEPTAYILNETIIAYTTFLDNDFPCNRH